MKKNCKLKIISLHDAKAECSCGWYYSFTGEMTAREIKNQHRKPSERIGERGERLGKVITHTGNGSPLYELIGGTRNAGEMFEGKKVISVAGFHELYMWRA